MRAKKFFDYLNDSSRDLQERLFALLSFIAICGLLMALGIGLMFGENRESVLLTSTAIVLFTVTVLMGYRFQKPYLASVVVSVLLVFGFLPLTFFTSGGINGGTPIWFVFVTVYISMILRRREQIFFLANEGVVTIVCWYTQFFYPDRILKHTHVAMYLDSLGSLLIVSFVLTVLVSFQIKMYSRESQESQRQKQEIEKLIDAQNNFFSTMSHEIRTPINTIIGLNEIILRQNASAEINEDAENIQAAGNILLHLVNDILDVSKMESGQMELVERRYQTADLIMDVVGMLNIQARRKGLDFRVDVSRNLPRELIGDEVRIKQVLINVLNNAIKYTREGAVELVVEFRKQSDQEGVVTYSVIDTGIGIKKESLPFLFTAFRRVDEERTRFIEGTGLGLSIVERLVNLMGGRITVNSIYTRGSTFIIEIPQQIADNALVDPYRLETERRDSRNHLYHQSFEAPDAKVLVVDDNDANLMVAKKLLTDTKVQITLARSGAEALEKTQDNEFHVIFMDHMMPEMNGIECMHKIHAQAGGRSRKARIVCLTARAEQDNEALYAKEGFDGYLIKPIVGRVLERELRRHLPKNLITVTGQDEEFEAQTMSIIDEQETKREIIVTTESVADLPREEITEDSIRQIPYKVLVKDGVFRDGVEVTSWGALRLFETGGDGDAIHSQSPSEEDYENFFAEGLTHANNIIHISMPGTIKGSGLSSAMEAARSFNNVFVVDGGHLSCGLAILALAGREMAKEGFGTAEIVRELNALRERIHSTFIADNLDRMASGEYIHKAPAYLTHAFMIRPMIVMKNGAMSIPRVFIGSWDHAAKAYIRSSLSMSRRIDTRVLYIPYAGLELEEMELIRSEVKKRAEFQQIHMIETSAVIAVNSGGGAFGLVFLYRE